MQSCMYKGFSVWGHAIFQQNRYAASGTITRGTTVVESSGVLAHFMTEQEAEVSGLEWAKAWVDRHT
jgi:hypothetical protein